MYGKERDICPPRSVRKKEKREEAMGRRKKTTHTSNNKRIKRRRRDNFNGPGPPFSAFSSERITKEMKVVLLFFFLFLRP
jgi:hypothetical protein